MEGGPDGVNENKIPTIRIYRRGPVDDVEHAAEGGEEGGLAAPGAAADSYTLPPRDDDGGQPTPQTDEGVGTRTKTATKTMMDFIF